MKLSAQIISRISVVLLILMAVWAALFYFIIIDEINDETDDALEDYSEYIINRALTGEDLPTENNGTNNSYFINEVTSEYASRYPSIQYFDEMVYILSKEETEPARILKTIFSNSNDKYYELTVYIPTIEKADLQETILQWIIILYIVLLLTVIIINYLILQRSFRPLYKILDWLDNFRVNQKMPELNINIKTTEFRKLQDSVIRNAHRNIESYEQQKVFIGNAAHELQTPLAICLNRLEMLSDDPELTQKQLEEIIKTKQSLNDAVKLNKTLLLLTKIENDQFPDKKEIIVNDIVKKLTEDYLEVYEAYNISLSIHEEAILKVQMNETLALILFGNLIKNAFIHNYNSGMITIHISKTHVTIANTGDSKALDSDGIFNRFYQGSKKEGSTGLGLALSKSICKLYNINIQYQFTESKHTFTLSF